MKTKCPTCQQWFTEDEERHLLGGAVYHPECVPPGAAIQLPLLYPEEALR